MIKYLTKIKAWALLIAIALVWGLFIFDTHFGHLQLAMLGLCGLLNASRKPLNFFFSRFSWYSKFQLKYERIRHQLNSWCFTLWLSNDQYINTVFRGNEDHSVSGRVGFLSVQGHLIAREMEKVIDAIFYVIVGQRRHCRDSIEKDEVNYV